MLLRDFVLHVYAARRPGLQNKTILERLAAVTLLSRWLQRPAEVADLTEANVAGFLRDLVKVRSPSTVNSRGRALLTLWKDARRARMVVEPLPELLPIRERLPLPEAWTLEEVSRIVIAAGRERGSAVGFPAGPYWQSLCLALLDTGGRIGAVARVRWSDVCLASPSPGLPLLSTHSKTARPQWCPLHPQTVAVCQQVAQPPRELFWPWPFGPESRRYHLTKILRRAGVRHGKAAGGLFHKFRRTSGSLVEAAGGDGARHLGNRPEVFARFYRDPRICGAGQLAFLPRPVIE